MAQSARPATCDLVPRPKVGLHLRTNIPGLGTRSGNDVRSPDERQGGSTVAQR